MQFEDRYVEITRRSAAHPTAKPTNRRDGNVTMIVLIALLLVGVVASSVLAVMP
jgi:hypothetical protein